MMKAIFVAVEGADCCGKGIQVKRLADHLEAKMFKFPDKNTPIGKIIYAHLFRNWSVSMGGNVTLLEPNIELEEVEPLMFQCMQMSNRLEHAKEILETLYTLGQCVVSDRYSASGVVYGGNDGLNPEYISKIQDYLPKPDLNILLDIDVETAAERMKGRGDTPDRYENPETIEQIIIRYRQYWTEMAQKVGRDKWLVVDGKLPEIEVAANVVAAVKEYRATDCLLKAVQQ